MRVFMFHTFGMRCERCNKIGCERIERFEELMGGSELYFVLKAKGMEEAVDKIQALPIWIGSQPKPGVVDGEKTCGGGSIVPGRGEIKTGFTTFPTFTGDLETGFKKLSHSMGFRGLKPYIGKESEAKSPDEGMTDEEFATQYRFWISEDVDGKLKESEIAYQIEQSTSDEDVEVYAKELGIDTEEYKSSDWITLENELVSVRTKEAIAKERQRLEEEASVEIPEMMEGDVWICNVLGGDSEKLLRFVLGWSDPKRSINCP